jgi:peptide chain release factor subunit 1
MEMGAVETLIVWENLEVERCILKNIATGDEVIKYMTKEQQAKADAYQCALTPFCKL